jgi:hypothetical protein
MVPSRTIGNSGMVRVSKRNGNTNKLKENDDD